jgi:hypothetical protein
MNVTVCGDALWLADAATVAMLVKISAVPMASNRKCPDDVFNVTLQIGKGF